MTRALYTVEFNGKIIARRDALTWVKLTTPGVYLVCGEVDGEGIIIDGEIYHVRGRPILPGKQTVKIDYIER